MDDLFCCSYMKQNTLQPNGHNVDKGCTDKPVYYYEIFDEYGLIVHDGGQSYITINFCPWCGEKLPETKRDDWFVLLGKLGYGSPFEDEIPEQFKSDAWREKQ